MEDNPMLMCGFVPVFKTQVKYRLEKAPNALVFQVLDESPDVKAFLNGRNFLSKKTGLRIAASKYPEFKHSKNVVFLRGSDTSNDYKLDVTRFVGNMQRDNAYDMIVTAIQELVDFVKSASTPYDLGGGNSYVVVPKPKVRNSYTGGNVIVFG